MAAQQGNSGLLRAYEWSLLAFVVTMPFNLQGLNLNGIAIGVLAFVSLLLAMKNKEELKRKPDMLFLMLVMFFLSYVASLLYSSNTHEANFSIEKKLSLFIFPVIMYISPRISAGVYKRVLISFVLSVILSCIAAFFISTVHYLQVKDPEVFFYHELSSNIGMHAGYLAMYLCFAIAILLFYKGQNNKPIMSAAIRWSAGVLASTLVLMLSSRLQIGIMCLIYLVYMFHTFKLKVGLPKAIGYSLAAGALLVFAVLIFPKNRERFKEVVNYNNEYALSKKWGEGQMRKLIWISAAEIIVQNPVIGVGVGDVQDELDKMYKTKDFISLTYFPNTRFNAHNQLLETILATGIIGGILLVCVLAMLWIRAMKQRNKILLAFVCIFVLSALTESILERQTGVVFYSFFGAFLVFKKPE